MRKHYLSTKEAVKTGKRQNKKGNRNEIEGKRFVGEKDEIIANGNDDETFTSLVMENLSLYAT